MAAKRASGAPARKKRAAKKRPRKAAVKKRAAKKRATKRGATKKRATKKRATKKRATKKRAAKKRATKKRAAKQRKLYTLTEIGKLAGVSMPTLQKYKRNHQDRIPSVGEGRRQRYPREAVAVLQQLKKENLAKRGRPRKGGAAAATAKGASGGELLTLTEISKITKISYPTLSRYVKLFLDRIPHVGSGRKRRYPREAIAAFRQLRSESRPGRPAAKKVASPRGSGDRDLGARIRNLEKAVAELVKSLKKPIQVTIRGR